MDNPPLLDTGQDRLNDYWRPDDLAPPPDEEEMTDAGHAALHDANDDGAETRGYRVDRDSRHEPTDDP